MDPSSLQAHPELFAASPVVPGGVWLAKARGTFAARDDGGIETRNPSVIHILGLVHQRHPDLPDFGPVYLCTQDAPSGRVPGPVMLAFSVDRRQPQGASGQRVIAVPDNVFDHWRNAGMSDYEDTCAQMRAAAATRPRKWVAGWVGNAYMHPSRHRLIEIAQRAPADVEALNTGVWKPVPGLPRFDVTLGRFISMPELVTTYAYLIDVEGNGWSGRLKLLLHSGRPLLLQQRPWEEFYFADIKPFEHYIPVASDLHDLLERVRWLKTNPKQATAIALAAQIFALTSLTRSAAIDAWAQILRTLA